jgi:hypothetical protein
MNRPDDAIAETAVQSSVRAPVTDVRSVAVAAAARTQDRDRSRALTESNVLTVALVIVLNLLGTGDDAYQKSHTIKTKSSSPSQAKLILDKQLYNIFD